MYVVWKLVWLWTLILANKDWQMRRLVALPHIKNVKEEIANLDGSVLNIKTENFEGKHCFLS